MSDVETKNKAVEVYAIVEKIPKGKVTTYGTIGKIAKINPRQVGWILHRNPDPKRIPCHRVVNNEGRLAKAFAFGGAVGQRSRLMVEGVEVINNRVELTKHFIVP